MRESQVKRKLDRLQTIRRQIEAGIVQIGEPLPIDIFFDSGDPDIVEIGEAEHMRRDWTVRVNAFVLRQEADPGKAEMIDFLLLFGRDAALHPDEALTRCKPVAKFARIYVRQHRGEQLRRFVLIDDAPRLGENRHHLHVGGKDFAVAVENVGTRSGKRVRRGATNALRVRLEAEINQPGIDRGEEANKAERDNANAAATLVEIRRE